MGQLEVYNINEIYLIERAINGAPEDALRLINKSISQEKNRSTQFVFYLLKSQVLMFINGEYLSPKESSILKEMFVSLVKEMPNFSLSRLLFVTTILNRVKLIDIELELLKFLENKFINLMDEPSLFFVLKRKYELGMVSKIDLESRFKETQYLHIKKYCQINKCGNFYAFDDVIEIVRLLAKLELKAAEKLITNHLAYCHNFSI